MAAKSCHHVTTTYPASLVSDPAGNLLHNNEATHERNDLREEATDAPLQYCCRHPVTETQQCDDTPPTDDTVSKQPAHIITVYNT